MIRIEKKYGNLDVLAMVPETGLESIVYVLEPLKVMPVLEQFVHAGAAIISIFGMDWNRDLTPWPAPAVLKKGGDFEGNADRFLASLIGTVIPELENTIGISAPSATSACGTVSSLTPESTPTPMTNPSETPSGAISERVCRYIVGVSLAGMFAVYSTFHTSLFDGAGSVSGSFWYDGFTDYIKDREPRARKYYLSIGEKEKEARNPRLAKSETCTREVETWLAGKGKKTLFELTQGGHFTEGPQRVADAIRWLIR